MFGKKLVFIDSLCIIKTSVTARQLLPTTRADRHSCVTDRERDREREKERKKEKQIAVLSYFSTPLIVLFTVL